jgi:hypothetical protein
MPANVRIIAQVKKKVSELACALFEVDKWEDLPEEVQDSDVVKFAEMSPSAISCTLVSVTWHHLCSLKNARHYYFSSILLAYVHLW